MQRASRLFVAIAATSLATLGCATTVAGFGPPQFPDRERVDALKERAAPPVKAPEARVAVETWTLAGPFADRVGDAPMKAGDALGDVVIATVGAARTSENMACAARELGRFMAQHQKSAEPRLERYLALRCGAVDDRLGFRSLTWSKVDDKTTDAALVERSRDQIVATLHDIGDGDLVGATIVRDAATSAATALFVHDAPRVALKPAPQTPQAGAYVVDGTVRAAETFEQVFAYVTAGTTGAAECTRDSTVALPAFRFTCPVAADDATALAELLGRARGRILSEELGEVLVVQKPEAASTWTRVAYATTTNDADVGKRALAFINDARKTVGAPALVEASSQSATVAKLAPHYFGALLGDKPDTATADFVALGAIAGYDVNEIVIHDASFAALVDYAGDVDMMMGEALDRPSLRRILLSPKATHAAVGVTALGANKNGVLVVGYEPLPAIDDKAAAAAVIAKLDQQRRQRGASETGAITPVADIMAAAAARLDRGDDVGAVGNDALHASVAKMSRGLGLWTLEAYDVDHLTFPADLLTSKMTYVSVAVANRKRKGSAWGTTEILILYATEDALRSAE